MSGPLLADLCTAQCCYNDTSTRHVIVSDCLLMAAVDTFSLSRLHCLFSLDAIDVPFQQIMRPCCSVDLL
jgi:hypothetical protein